MRYAARCILACTIMIHLNTLHTITLNLWNAIIIKKNWKQNIHPHSYLAARCIVLQARVLIDLFPHLLFVWVFFVVVSLLSLSRRFCNSLFLCQLRSCFRLHSGFAHALFKSFSFSFIVPRYVFGRIETYGFARMPQHKKIPFSHFRFFIPQSTHTHIHPDLAQNTCNNKIVVQTHMLCRNY